MFHDAQQSPAHLVTDGELPSEYVLIHQAKLREQRKMATMLIIFFDVAIDSVRIIDWNSLRQGFAGLDRRRLRKTLKPV